MNINQELWTSFPGLCPWDSSKQVPEQAKICSAEVQVVILPFALFPSLKIVNHITL